MQDIKIIFRLERHFILDVINEIPKQSKVVFMVETRMNPIFCSNTCFRKMTFPSQFHCELVKGIYEDKNRYPVTNWVYVQFFEANESMKVTHFIPVVHFYIPWKHREISCFLKFSNGTEMEYWLNQASLIIYGLFSYRSCFLEIILS